MTRWDHAVVPLNLHGDLGKLQGNCPEKQKLSSLPQFNIIHIGSAATLASGPYFSRIFRWKWRAELTAVLQIFFKWLAKYLISSKAFVQGTPWNWDCIQGLQPEGLVGFQSLKRIWSCHAGRGMKMSQATGDQRDCLYFNLTFSCQGDFFIFLFFFFWLILFWQKLDSCSPLTFTGFFFKPWSHIKKGVFSCMPPLSLCRLPFHLFAISNHFSGCKAWEQLPFEIHKVTFLFCTVLAKEFTCVKG